MRYTQTGKAVTRMGLAVQRPFANAQGERETDFIDVVVWDKKAENVAQYMRKGRLVAVDGRLQTRNYETPDGQKRKVYEIVADSVDFLDRAKDAPADGEEYENTPASTQAETKTGVGEPVPF